MDYDIWIISQVRRRLFPRPHVPVGHTTYSHPVQAGKEQAHHGSANAGVMQIYRNPKLELELDLKLKLKLKLRERPKESFHFLPVVLFRLAGSA